LKKRSWMNWNLACCNPSLHPPRNHPALLHLHLRRRQSFVVFRIYYHRVSVREHSSFSVLFRVDLYRHIYMYKFNITCSVCIATYTNMKYIVRTESAFGCVGHAPVKLVIIVKSCCWSVLALSSTTLIWISCRLDVLAYASEQKQVKIDWETGYDPRNTSSAFKCLSLGVTVALWRGLTILYGRRRSSWITHVRRATSKVGLGTAAGTEITYTQREIKCNITYICFFKK
jgi:hypothetical protein